MSNSIKNKIRCAKITNLSCDGHYVVDIRELFHLADLFADNELGETYQLELIEMEEEEYKNLPDFPGW